jgi:hypothetical protein
MAIAGEHRCSRIRLLSGGKAVMLYAPLPSPLVTQSGRVNAARHKSSLAMDQWFNDPRGHTSAGHRGISCYDEQRGCLVVHSASEGDAICR